MPPTLVSYTGTGNTNVIPTTGATTANIAVLTGDKVVIAGGGEDQAGVGTLTLSFNGGLTGTVTTHQSDQTSNYSPCAIGSADVTGDGNLQGKIVGSVGGSSKGMNVGVWVWRDHNGVGVTGKSHQANNTVPSLTLNGCTANSAIAAFVTDWNALNGARTYTQINGANPTERAHFGDAATWHFDAFDYADVGAAGNKTLGQSAPTNQKPNLLAVEILTATAAASVIPDIVMAPLTHN